MPSGTCIRKGCCCFVLLCLLLLLCCLLSFYFGTVTIKLGYSEVFGTVDLICFILICYIRIIRNNTFSKLDDTRFL